MPTDDAMPAQRPRRVLGRGPGAVTPSVDVPTDPPPVVRPRPPAPDPATAPRPGTEQDDEPDEDAEAGTAPAVEAEVVAPTVRDVGSERGPQDRSHDALEPGAEASPVLTEESPSTVSPAPRAEPGPTRDQQPGLSSEPDAASGRSRRARFGSTRDDGDQAERRDGAADDGRFTVVLDNFEGPFDLLLQLIAKHKLDVTEVALSRVTDEFMAHIQAMGPDWDLDQTTEFLVVAATLLDLKAARLLPAAEVEDEADLALLEARDLLFAHLLQYRAFKEIADLFAHRFAAEARRHPRTVGLEPQHAELLPEVVISIGREGFAKLAVKAMQPKPKPQVYVDHIHAPLVSVREQADVVIARLRAGGEVSFQRLIEDAPDVLTVVARFLALLELYRERAVILDQQEALGPLLVRWSGDTTVRPLITDEFDQEPGERTESVADEEDSDA